MTYRSASTPGSLYIVATPIGNLEDISRRAIRCLESVDCILAEDTRHSATLLKALGIHKPLQSYHAHNEQLKTEALIQRLLEGENFALISDAGTPLIADPGYPLVHRAQLESIPVVPIPGPSALITALSAAGVPTDCFSFLGFLPAKSKARRERLAAFLPLGHTLVFYESSHRIMDCLEDLVALCGADTELVLAKELTKIYERIMHASCASILEAFRQDSQLTRGEFVLILPARAVEPSDQSEQFLAILQQELPLKQAVKLTALLTGRNKNAVYKMALKE